MMDDGVSFKLEGIEELSAKLKELPIDLRRKGGRFALRKAAQVVRDGARTNAKALNDPQTAEIIADNIVERWSGRYFKSTGGDMKFRVGVMGGAKSYANTSANVRARRVGKTYSVGGDKGNPGGDTFYWRFLEFGTSQIPSQPFMRKALAQNISKVTSTFIAEYSKALDRAIKRASKGR
jgi:HK97 gp10 family phage protein